MHVPVWECEYPVRSEDAVPFPQAEITGVCELLPADAGT